jgi:hypothetical protein
VAWSSDGRWIVAAGSNLQMYDAGTGARIWTSATRYREAQFSPGNSFIVAWTPDRVDILERATGSVVCGVAGHTQQIQAACMSGNERMLVTCAADCTALVWDMKMILNSGIDASVPDVELSRLIRGMDAGMAFRAGLAQLQRDPAALRTSTVEPPAQDPYESMIAALSDPDAGARERAHRQLEKAGAAASPAIARAMRKPPEGEAGERLKSLSRLTRTTDVVLSDEPVKVVPEAVRAGRIRTLLTWNGVSPSTAPTSQP